jgi:ATP-binding cassette subfamily F protein 3
VFISHDRYFINRVANRVVEVEGGGLTTYLGTYDDYLAAKAAAERSADALADATLVLPLARRRSLPARSRVSAEMGALRRRLEEVERQIHALETRLRELETAFADPSLYADGDRVRAVTTERKSAEEQVAWLMREWEELSTQLASHE